MDDLCKEIQMVFSNCSTESNDKIRSSVFIEEITLKYGLNDELKNKLIDKLDPENEDQMYTKEQLFNIFKEWISSRPPEIKMFSESTSSPCCSSSTPKSVLMNFQKRTKKLLTFDDSFVFETTPLNEESSQGSSSTKKRLSYNNTNLASRLDLSEKYGFTMEKKCEDLNNLCASQKIEIQRLNMKLRTQEEFEHLVEEANEQKREIELENKKKCARLQTELTVAHERIEDMALLINNLQLKLTQSGEFSQSREKELLTERDKLLAELSENRLVNEDIRTKLITLEQRDSDREQAFSRLLEDNDAMASELIGLRNNINDYSEPDIQFGGIPLCEELASEMMVLENTATSSVCFIGPITHKLESRSCQTDGHYFLNDVLSVSSQTEQVEPTFLQTEMISTLVQSIGDLRSRSNSSQTDRAEVNSTYSQTEHRRVMASSSQTDLCQRRSCFSQTGLRRMNSTSSQTAVLSVQNNLFQTEQIILDTRSSQTAGAEISSNSVQTEYFGIKAYTQTKNDERHSNFSQTENIAVNSNFTQTELCRYSENAEQRFLLSRIYEAVIRTSITFAVLFAVFLAFIFYCKNDRCRLLYLYPRGGAPV